MKWTEAESEIVLREYPKRGWRGVQAMLPHRRQAGIRCHAASLGCQQERRVDEPAVVTPTHDYTDDDRAWQSARLPVFNRGLLTWRFA